MFWQKITKADQFLVDLVYSLGLGKGPRVFTTVFQYGFFLVNLDPTSLQRPKGPKESALQSVKGQKVCAPNFSKQAGQSSIS